jgi:hypothetical protein
VSREGVSEEGMSEGGLSEEERGMKALEREGGVFEGQASARERRGLSGRGGARGALHPQRRAAAQGGAGREGAGEPRRGQLQSTAASQPPAHVCGRGGAQEGERGDVVGARRLLLHLVPAQVDLTPAGAARLALRQAGARRQQSRVSGGGAKGERRERGGVGGGGALRPNNPQTPQTANTRSSRRGGPGRGRREASCRPAGRRDAPLSRAWRPRPRSAPRSGPSAGGA